jgi:CRISPR-associated protein Cmr2
VGTIANNNNLTSKVGPEHHENRRSPDVCLQASEYQHVLDFTLSPVQGFVGQARRTRDFWAGSYLISYLTAHAIKGFLESSESITQDPGRSGEINLGDDVPGSPSSEGMSKIIFPFVHDDPLLCAVMGTKIPESEFEDGARIASLPNRFTGKCSNPVAAGEAAAEAVRSAWTNLSLGVWKAVRARLARSFMYTEVLPEFSYEDSLPPTWARQLENHWEPYWVAGAGPAGVDQRKNWRQMYVFDETGEICTMCGERVVAFGEGLPRWKVRQIWHGEGGIVECINGIGASDQWRFALDVKHKERLCAVCLLKRIFPHVAEDVIGWPVPVSFPSTHDLAYALGGQGSSDAAGPEFPYYSVLLMDGDNMGRHLTENPNRTDEISEAISSFSRMVPQVVERQYQGKVVYAGGDDVLAFLPANAALCCAESLRKLFVSASESSGVPMTISAAILYTHIKSPLQAALATTHRLLDNIAKDGIGRDAFVIQVEKRGGSPLTVAKPWESKADNGVHGESNVLRWAECIDELSSQVFGSKDEGYSSRFLYNISELLEPFIHPCDAGSSKGPTMEAVDMLPVLAAEYLRGPGALMKVDWDEAIRRMRKLYSLCLWEPRESGKVRDRLLQPEALPLIKFLAEAEGVK